MKWVILLAGVVNLFLAFFVWRRNPKSKLNIYFGVLGGITSLWILNNFLFRVYPNLFFLRNSYAIGALVPALSLWWIIFFSGRKFQKKWKSMVFILAAIFAVSSHMGGLIVKELLSINFAGYQGVTGPLFPVYSLYILCMVSYIIFVLFSSYKKAEGVNRIRIRLVLIGLFLWIFNVVLVSFILPMLGILEITSLDSPSSLIFIAFIAFAITRYRLMDIRAIVARTIAFGSIVILLVAIFSVLAALLALFTTQILGKAIDQTSNTIIVAILISVLVAVGYNPLRKFVEKATDQFLFQKSYNPDELLAKVSNVSSSILDLQQLLKALSIILSEAFKFEKIGFAFITPEGNFKVVYKDGFKPAVAESLAEYPDAVSIFIKEMKQTPGLLVIDEMYTQYKNGEFKPVDSKFLEILHENNIAVIIPLYSKEDLVGLAVLGSKKSGDQYNQQDIITLGIFAGQAAVAIENAKLYDELKYFNIKLEQEVKEKTTELRSANSQLKRLDQAKSDFISIASHQLRTPLTVIKGYISMMQEGSFGKVPQKIDENLTKVFLSNERLINLVEDLLNISRIESGRQQFEWTKVNLVELAQRLTENLEQNAKAKGLALKFHQPKEEVPIIIAEYNKLHDVMINFIDNAIKYTAEGKIDVTVENGPKGMVTFKVKDTGRGIDPDTMASLFQKFSRGQGSFQVNAGGTGLGLYVAKMIVDAHEGKVWAESEGRDKGSAFCFSLPIAGPKKKTDLPFAQEGQKVEKPVASAPVASVPAVAPSQLKKEGKKKKKK